ncbi:30S ribosomal protein S1 [Caldalkalibacillus mannanilyticus]|uniref:30S ribosomal protein S1 n=1 Tax=Caldalkalibacillus mannanilyticus TaxID=1418 RepID=UPI000467F67C|nr:30S ribosomal protein S1 [Caldalkalibacillus mannanilyticus]
MVDETQNEVEVKSYSVGDLIEGTVTKVEDKHVLIDFGYKHDAILPIGEISNVHIEKAGDAVAVGDSITAKVTKVTDEEIVVSKKAVDNEKAWDVLEQKLSTGEVFEITVADVVKGGLVADVGVRAFIPASLVERTYVEDFTDYKGRSLRVKVIELDKEKNKVILSQKAVLDEEFNQSKKDSLNKIEVGQTLEGTVQRLTSFGAFVDIGGGIDGLIHISELAWHRVESPSEVVKEGDSVKVKVLKVDTESERVSLSLKETEESPWDKAIAQIKVGDVVKGTVRRLVSFGAFVEIQPGVEGLVHISQIANRHIGTPGEVLKEGQEVEAKVLDITPQEQRISLSIRELLEEEEQAYTNDYVPQETTGMGVTLGDMIGDKLKKLK